MKQADLKELLDWYATDKRALPWRENTEPYGVLVSEFMLQQTTVATVVPRYLAWMERFPTFEALAQASEEEVLSQWSGLGYYQRARRLHRVAQIVACTGTIPDRYETLLELPGLGPYTAAAVASICFELPHLAIDTNVIRVLYRYYAIERNAKEKLGHDEIKKRSQAALQERRPGDVNQALMELGATRCRVKNPLCDSCPLAQGCSARHLPNGPESLPLASPRKEPRRTPGVAIVLERDRDGSVLLIRGTQIGVLEQLYQPPIAFDELPTGVSNDLLDRLTDRNPDAVQTIRYGLSGRMLELECRRWRLTDERLEPLVALLERTAQVRWWPSDRKGRTPP